MSGTETTERLPPTRVLRTAADSSQTRPRRILAALIAGAAAIGLLAAIGVWTSSAADIVTGRAVAGITAPRPAPATTAESDSATTPTAVTVDGGDPGPSTANDDKHAEHAAEVADRKAELAAEVADKKSEHDGRGNSGKGK
jgi:hypothetical protein